MVPDWVTAEKKHPSLHKNKNGSLTRLSNLLSRLQRDPALVKEYDDKIEEQFAEETIAKAPANKMPKEFYIPHKSVVKQSAKTTKLRIVYDASAKLKKARVHL